MKKHYNRWIPVLCAVVLALPALACTNGLQDPPEGSPAPVEIPPGKGLVRVNIGSPARTVLPDAARLYYTLEFTRNGERESAVIPIGGQSVECTLRPGIWELLVKGYGSAEEAGAGGTVLVSGTAQFRVNGGEMAEVVVALYAVQTENGRGTLRYTLNFPVNAKSLEFRLLPLTGSGSLQDLNMTGPELQSGNVDGVLDNLPEGYYRMSITVTLYDQDRALTLKAGRIRVVHIYGSLETEINETFAPGGFEEIPTFTSLGDMKTYLAGKELNDRETPYYTALRVPVADLALGADPLGGLFDALADRYAAVDLEECTGTALTDISPAPSRSNARGLVSLLLPKNLESIGNYNFANCNSLRSVKFPPTLRTIGDYAFNNDNSLVSVELPPILIRIGNSAFSSCDALQSADWPRAGPNAVIESSAFSRCPLVSVKLPGTVKTIGASAFSSCNFLQSAEWPEAPAGAAIDASAFNNCPALVSVSLPATLTSIGNAAFSGCASLASIELPRDLASLGTGAFGNCYSLSSVSIPGGLSALPGNAFANCVNLGLVRVPPSITGIETTTFSGCAIVSFDTTGNTKYSTDPLGKMLIENGTTIVRMPETGEIDIPAGVNYGAAFKGKILITAVTARGEVPEEAFSGCISLKKATIIDAGNINANAFKDCTALRGVEFKGISTITSISGSAFSNCKSLETLTLPATLTTISTGAFSGCTSLRFNVDSGNTAFRTDSSGAVLITGGAVFTAQGASGEITIPGDVTAINANTFQGSRLTGVTWTPDAGIPNVSIGNEAFKDCVNLANAPLPEKLTNIGIQAFYGCTALETAAIPSTLSTIPASAFRGSGLRWVKWSNVSVGGPVSIEQYAFSDCTSLEKVELPDTLNTIGVYAFYGCTALKVVIIRSTAVPTLSNANAFSSCTDPALTFYKVSGVNYTGNWTNTFFTGRIIDIDADTPNPDDWT